MRHVYLAYLDHLCSQPHNCRRQANSNRTMARLEYCRALGKLVWGEPLLRARRTTPIVILTRSCYQYILCGPSKIDCCLGGPQDI